MNADIRGDLEQLRATLGDELGFAFQDDQLEQLGHTLRGRMRELGDECFDAYASRLRSSRGKAGEIRVLAERLTVTETFFCRQPEQLRALIDTVIPACVARGRRLRILSAGCASGEEPYSIAIALREAIPDLDSWDVKIFGLDVNRAMLEKAAAGRYVASSLRATPESIKSRYFRAVGREFLLDSRVRELVEFREHNLVDPNPLFYRALAADAIFCRNVITYFTPESIACVIDELTSALLPGGHLFLGPAETLRGLSHDYQLRHTHGTFYYQRRERLSSRPPASSVRPPPPPPLLSPLEEETSWFDVIQAATRRGPAATGNAEESTTSTAPASHGAPTAGHASLARVLDLVERERFDEALALLESSPQSAGQEPDGLLLSAVLLTNQGRLAEAERACQRLLASDDLHAGAHYLTALCREHSGDVPCAREHDRIAAHLDPTFAMPRLHAGLLAKRAGDRSTARRELAQALLLLAREDTPRVVLFGGGFSREALVSLCRTELARLDSP